MAKVIILVGPPGSGKSTWAKKYLLNHGDTLRVNRDEYRLMLRNQNYCEPKIESLISKMQDATILEALGARLDVIIDQTNCKLSRIEHYINLLSPAADIEFLVFDISLKKAIINDATRPNPVGEEIVKAIYEDFVVIRDSYPFNKIPKSKLVHIQPNYSSPLPPAVIFDVDGTLALMNNRGPFDWDKVHRDELNEVVKEQVLFHKSLHRKIIVVSGRDEESRKDSQDWFDMYDIPYDYFYMRPKGDMRKDIHIKKEIYENEILGKYNVICVYDDRKVVVEKWREMGLFVFDVNQHKVLF
jgi:predicted kinase